MRKPFNAQSLEEYGECCGTCAHWNPLDAWCAERACYSDAEVHCSQWTLFGNDEDLGRLGVEADRRRAEGVP